jgi:hypothetical protein
MAAPTGVSSGSAPEPVVPEPPATLESAVPQPSEPGPGENAAASAVPQPSEPGPGENAAASPSPPPTELALGENAAASADPEPSEPAADPEHQPLANQRARPGRRLGWLVTAGVVIVVIAAAAAVGVLAVASHGFRPKTIVKYRPAAVYALRAGECINSSPNGLSVTILSCSTPHEAEVFATFSLTGSDWPGSAAVQQQASDGCANRVAGYLNPQLLNAGLTEEYVYPNQDAWKAGIRTVVCEVSAASGPLSGSVRQGG